MTLKDLNEEKEKLRIKMRRGELSLEDKQKLKNICAQIDEIEIPKILAKPKYKTLKEAQEGLKDLNIIYSTKVSPKNSLNDVTKHVCINGPKKGKITYIDKEINYCNQCGRRVKHKLTTENT